MHVLCGLIVGGGLTYAWQRTWLKIAGTCGLLGAAITLHAIYNLLIAYGGTVQYIAYVLPVLLITAGKLRIFAHWEAAGLPERPQLLQCTKKLLASAAKRVCAPGS